MVLEQTQHIGITLVNNIIANRQAEGQGNERVSAVGFDLNHDSVCDTWNGIDRDLQFKMIRLDSQQVFPETGCLGYRIKINLHIAALQIYRAGVRNRTRFLRTIGFRTRNVRLADGELVPTDVNLNINNRLSRLAYADIAAIAENSTRSIINASIFVIVGDFLGRCISQKGYVRRSIAEMPNDTIGYEVQLACKMHRVLTAKFIFFFRREFLPVDINRLADGLHVSAGRISIRLILGKTVHVCDEVTAFGLQRVRFGFATKRVTGIPISRIAVHALELRRDADTIQFDTGGICSYDIDIMCCCSFLTGIGGESDLVDLLLNRVDPQHSGVTVVLTIAVILLRYHKLVNSARTGGPQYTTLTFDGRSSQCSVVFT